MLASRLRSLIRFVVLLGLVLAPVAQAPARAAELQPAQPAASVPLNPAAAPAAPLGVTCGGVLEASEDTTLDASDPNTNFGGGPLLNTSAAAGDEFRSLVNFDLSSLPVSATLYSALLVLTVADYSGDAPFEFAVHAATAAWTEGSATWNAQPAFGPALAVISDTVWDNGSMVTLTVTTLVTQWLNGDAPAEGLVLNGTLDNTLQFYSRESGTVDYRPRLVFDCALFNPANPEDQAAADADQLTGLNRLRQNSTISPTVELENGAVRFAMFRLPLPAERRADPLDGAWWFLETYADLLRLPDPHSALQFSGHSDGKQDFVFRRLHNGIPVYPAELTVHLEGDYVAGLNGRYIAGLTLDPTPRLSAEEAQASALAASSPGAATAGDTQLRYVNLGLLGYPDSETHLAWQVNVGDPLLGGRSLFIDAHTGDLLATRSYTFDSFDLDLETANNFGPDPIACFFFTTSDDQWFDENGPAAGWPDPVPPTPDAEGNAAFASITAIDQFWRTQLGRDSYNNGGQRYNLFIHAGVAWQNAHYTSWCDFFEFGDNMSNRDIMAHEITHGVVEKVGGLIYENQSGALNESYADIFSHFVDTDDWTIGEGSALGVLRDIGNPPAQGDPDHMLAGISGDATGLRVLPAGTGPDCNTNDCGFVHTNSGIHNKVGALLIQGGIFNTRSITALGLTKAARLFYGVLNNRRLSNSAQFIDARNAAVAEATSLASTGAFGFTSNNVCQVRNAYAAVGLGVGDADCDGVPDTSETDNDGDGVPNTTDNCLNIANSGQSNTDGGAQGDACDPDDDGDGVLDGVDNCPLVSNVGQDDGNANNRGDACDDRDSDGVVDVRDNCVNTPNNNQRNRDYDSFGDACDADRDGDGVPNNTDNSPDNYNPLQTDTDGDGYGNASDLCPSVNSADNGDPDGDGLGNPCDPDDDGDGVLDGVDNCPLVANASQIDTDSDGAGFACDSDEQEALFGPARIINDLVFMEAFPVIIPLPICPMCGGPDLPLDYLQRVIVDLPAGVAVRISDSTGQAAAMGIDNGVLQELQFQPPPYALTSFALAAGAGLQTADPLGEPGPSGIRYYLELYAGEGVDLNQSYTVTVTLEALFPTDLYLPRIER